MKFLALDVGKKRIGVATCDPMEIAASPHSIVKAGRGAVKQIMEIISSESIQAIVIGLPISLDGQERESCHRARALKNLIAKETDLPIDFFDERFTSKIAENSMLEAGMNADDRKKSRDAVAASLILQGFLEKRKRLRKDK